MGEIPEYASTREAPARDSSSHESGWARITGLEKQSTDKQFAVRPSELQRQIAASEHVPNHKLYGARSFRSNGLSETNPPQRNIRNGIIEHSVIEDI
jgi:hypothetical protein